MSRTRLSALDEIMPDIDLSFVLSFPLAAVNRPRTVKILSRAYDTLLQDVPILATCLSKAKEAFPGLRPGTLVLSPLESHSSAKIEIGSVHAKPCETYEELSRRELPMAFLSPSRLGLDQTYSNSYRRVLSVRIEFIEGGCFLIFRTSHAFVDATGLASIISLFADRCHNIADDANLSKAIPACDALPTSLSPSTESGTYATLKQNSWLWHMLGLDYRPKEESSSVLAGRIKQQVSTTRLFSISRSKLEEIHAMGVRHIQSSELVKSSWVSPNDSLAAWLWRCIVRARSPSIASGASTTLMMPMNVRRLLDPPVEASYLGNAVIYSLSTAQVDDLTSPNTHVSTIASTIRAGINHHKQPTLLSDCIKLAATIPDIQSLGLVFPTWLAQDVVLSSLVGLDLYNINFGSTFGDSTQGTPDFVRFPQGMFDGINFVMPTKRDGSVEISVTMVVEHMDRLVKDKDFSDFATLMLG